MNMSIFGRTGRYGILLKNISLSSPTIVLLGALLIYPVGDLLALSFQSKSGFSLYQYKELFASAIYVKVLWITLKISFATTIFSVITAYPIAYYISCAPKKRKFALLFWVLLSFWTSFLVRAFAWIIFLQRDGVVNNFLIKLGIISHPLNLLYNFESVLIGMVSALMPLAILTILSVMENIDRNLSLAASTLGARPGTQFWKVYFPLSLPGVASGALMVFITSIGFFIVPTLLGSPRDTMITQLIIEQIFQTLDWKFAGSISFLLLFTALFIFAIYNRIFGLSTISAKQTAPNAKDSFLSKNTSKAGNFLLTFLAYIFDFPYKIMPKKHVLHAPCNVPIILKLSVWILLFLITIPAVLMIPLSFSHSDLSWPPHGFTLYWYHNVIASPIWSQALERSLIAAFGCGILSLLLGIPMSFLLVRSNIKLKTLLLGFVLLPIIVPRVVIAVGMFHIFAEIGLVGSIVGLILGHTVIALPYVVLTMIAVLQNYDTRLDQAAQSLGAGPIAMLTKITLPILSAGILSSFAFAFATSFDDLTIALFTSGGLNSTLPKELWDAVTLQVSPTIAVVSTCLFLSTGLFLVVAEYFRRRTSVS